MQLLPVLWCTNNDRKVTWPRFCRSQEGKLPLSSRARNWGDLSRHFRRRNGTPSRKSPYVPVGAEEPTLRRAVSFWRETGREYLKRCPPHTAESKEPSVLCGGVTVPPSLSASIVERWSPPGPTSRPLKHFTSQLGNHSWGPRSRTI